MPNSSEVKAIKTGRKESGISLVLILGIGIVAMLWMAAVFSTLLPSFRRVTVAKNDSLSRATAEAAVDWACDQLSTAQGQTMLDGSNSGSSPDPYGVNTIVPPDQLPAGATATINLKNVSPTAPVAGGTSGSAIYSAALAASNTGNKNFWRMMTVTATVPGGTTKRIRVALMPVQASGSGSGSGNGTPPPPPGDPLFVNALAAYGTVDIKGGAKTYSIDSSEANGVFNGSTFDGKNANADVASNKNILISNGSSISGDVTVLGNTTTSTANVTSDNAKGTHINGIVETTGTTNISSKNIGNVANDPGGAVQTKSTNAPIPMISTAAPSTATPINLTNVSGTVNLVGGTTYTTTSLKLNTKGLFNITGSGPVNIYVNGAGGTLQISSSKTSVALPANLRIWYTGGEDVHVDNGANFAGVIFAPNATVHIDNGGMIVGSVLAKNVTVDNGGTFVYDTDLNNANLGMNAQWTPPTATTTTAPAFSVASYQALSWQEF